MEITNMKYIWCPRCGTEAREFTEINEKFGYRIKNRKEIAPHQKCKMCRGEQESNTVSDSKEKKSDWTMKYYTVNRWAKETHMNVAELKKYLYELGYLERGSNSNRKCIDQLTEKGKEHIKIQKIMGRALVLWDFEVFAEVLKRDAASVIGLLVCPRCKGILGELSNEHSVLENIEMCQRCGYTGKDKLVQFEKR